MDRIEPVKRPSLSIVTMVSPSLAVTTVSKLHKYMIPNGEGANGDHHSTTVSPFPPLYKRGNSDGHDGGEEKEGPKDRIADEDRHHR